MQALKNKTKEKEILNKSLIDEFNEIKNKSIEEIVETQPVVRIVTLSYKSCCGCGCSYEDIIRTVDYDSPLQNGDIATKFLYGDTYR